MRAVDLIRKKRDGGTLDREEIAAFVEAVTRETMPDYQVAALLMAIALRGLSADETWWLTDAMVRSGERLDLGGLSGPKVDKHSTGGVGDKTSLVAAPLAAACGVLVPKMSGRALGHTGGTLDKLESIPGFRTELAPAEILAGLRRVGCVLVGQSAAMVPADRRLYALRDVTATVESVPLIAASIMSKKLAGGPDALVLDVKTGSGAFMKTLDEARALAAALVALGTHAGVKTEAVISDMDAPLGRHVGNTLEVVEAAETLKGRGPEDLETLAVTLAGRMVQAGALEPTEERAARRVRDALTSGRGLETLRAIVANQGGEPRALDDYGLLPHAPHRHLITADRAGYVARIDAELIGQATARLGAGRDRVGQAIDYGAGIRLLARPGDAVRAGDEVLELHYSDEARLQAARPLAVQAMAVAPAPPPGRPLVLASINDASAEVWGGARR